MKTLELTDEEHLMLSMYLMFAKNALAEATITECIIFSHIKRAALKESPFGMNKEPWIVSESIERKLAALVGKKRLDNTVMEFLGVPFKFPEEYSEPLSEEGKKALVAYHEEMHKKIGTLSNSTKNDLIDSLTKMFGPFDNDNDNPLKH